VKTTVLPCPVCRNGEAPRIQRGGHSGKYFLLGCDHVWAVVDYTKTAASEQEAADRWNAWTRTQGKTKGIDAPAPQE
jgi:hypothetical protein